MEIAARFAGKQDIALARGYGLSTNFSPAPTTTAHCRPQPKAAPLNVADTFVSPACNKNRHDAGQQSKMTGFGNRRHILH